MKGGGGLQCPAPCPPPVARALQQLRWIEEDARLVLDAVAASGLTNTAFALRYKVGYQRLNVWHRRLVRTPTASKSLQFVELPAPAALLSSATPRYELHLPPGDFLRVLGPLEVDTVRTLLTLLREQPPC